MRRVFLVTLLIAMPLVAIPLLSIPVAHAANNKDWVLEKRFKSQLKAAQGGDKQAQLEVGRMYEKGRGVDQDMQKAIEWLEKSAAQGQPSAKAELGTLYFEGEGIAADYDKAFVLLSAAASANVPSAQYYLAKIYEQGKGTRRNLTAALKWYRQAADNGYYPAEAAAKAVQSKLAARRAPAPRPKPVVIHKQHEQVNKTQQTVLAGAWTYNGKAVAYLPSSATVCAQQGKGEVDCVSNRQTRNVGPMIITYRTRARLSGFKTQGNFAVSYTNEILKVEAVKKKGETAADQSAAKRMAEQHQTEHALSCELKDNKHIDCKKDKFLAMEFVNAANR